MRFNHRRPGGGSSTSLGPTQSISRAGRRTVWLAGRQKASLWRSALHCSAFGLSNIFRQMSRKRDNILTHNANFIHTQNKHTHADMLEKLKLPRSHVQLFISSSSSSNNTNSINSNSSCCLAVSLLLAKHNMTLGSVSLSLSLLCG